MRVPVLAGAIVTAAWSQSPGSGSVQQRVVLRYFHEVLDQRKVRLLEELFHPQCVIHRPEATLTGLEGIRGVVERNIAAFSKLETQVHDIFESGDRVTVRLTHRATGGGVLRSRLGIHDIRGKPVTWDAMAIFRLEKGKIVEEWVSRDELGILLRLGVIKPSGELR